MMKKSEHLIVDALSDSSSLSDPKYINRFVHAMVDGCGLNIEFIKLVEFPNGSDFGLGITAIAVLTESHLVIHTAPNRRTINIDLFSCKEIDLRVAREIIGGFFPDMELRKWDLIKRE